MSKRKREINYQAQIEMSMTFEQGIPNPSVAKYLKKRFPGIPYWTTDDAIWTRQLIDGQPTFICVCDKHPDHKHIAYWDGEKLWNPNDSNGDISNDGFQICKNTLDEDREHYVLRPYSESLYDHNPDVKGGQCIAAVMGTVRALERGLDPVTMTADDVCKLAFLQK